MLYMYYMFIHVCTRIDVHCVCILSTVPDSHNSQHHPYHVSTCPSSVHVCKVCFYVHVFYQLKLAVVVVCVRTQVLYQLTMSLKCILSVTWDCVYYVCLWTYHCLVLYYIHVL